MWQADSPPKEKPRLPSSAFTASTSQLSKARPDLLKRALSFQFLNRTEDDGLTREQRAHIKLRYKDISKFVIWPSCRFDKLSSTKPVPLVRPVSDPRAVLYRPDMEDERSPYLAATINHVLRSDSEDSSDAEEINRITRL